MNTYTDSRQVKPMLPRAAVLVSLMVVTLAAGCGEPLESEAVSYGEAEREIRDCSSGTCSDPTNGQGIYVAKDFGYCIPYSREQFFCPEYFSQTSSGAALTGLVIGAKGETVATAETLSAATGRWLGVTVDVLRVALDSHGLVIVVNPGSGEKELSGSDLNGVIIDLKSTTQAAFSLRIRPSGPDNGVELYQAEYFAAATATWESYCADGVGKVAFLPQRTVDDVTAKVKEDAGKSALTMACRTGAIATCMVWGYRPHEETDSERAKLLDVAYGACLQAKRAAYFVQSGDYKSYTVEGTHIALQDAYGIMNAPPVAGVEAVWGPEGALCFSPAYRRIPNPGAPPMPALPGVLPVPECDERLHEAAQLGQLQLSLTGDAPLATGPVTP